MIVWVVSILGPPFHLMLQEISFNWYKSGELGVNTPLLHKQTPYCCFYLFQHPSDYLHIFGSVELGVFNMNKSGYTPYSYGYILIYPQIWPWIGGWFGTRTLINHEVYVPCFGSSKIGVLQFSDQWFNNWKKRSCHSKFDDPENLGQYGI